ncbi:MAG TPA: serine/threonine-protein kinase [Phycisphaerae bacterium]|nr:serine/threonine-protein kinase [Phycisphaerae bacterium]
MDHDVTKLRAIFDEAIQATPECRSEILDARCAGDAALRGRVEALLATAESDGPFLSEPTRARPATLSDAGARIPSRTFDAADHSTELAAPLTEKPGTRIGPYKLLQQIGEGGFGVVFMAEQESPVRRRVALKIIKLGMDTRQVVARFEQERQALALMDHPHIARVFDAGATNPARIGTPSAKDGGPISEPAPPRGAASRIDRAHALGVQGSDHEVAGATEPRVPGRGHTENLAAHSEQRPPLPYGRGSVEPIPIGRPYFVMEYVKGDPITQFADAHKLSVRERLDLFTQVCSAVQHAHTKGVIHRDLKPGNVLVNMTDGRPFAKVIDFGIAKATGARLTDKTLFTEHRQLIGTPEYMSPEQAEGSPDIDTRTDVYALGVLLYELLTGATPFDAKRLRSAAFAEMQRIIKEEDPPAPSLRLSRSLETLAATAAARQAEPNKLGTLIKGELDWIVMKALDKDRGRRYESANQFRDDVRRHLAGEPISAAPPSMSYLLRKYMRKHKGPMFVGSALLSIFMFATIAIMWHNKTLQNYAKVLAETNVKLDMQNALLLDEKKRARLADATHTVESLLDTSPSAHHTEKLREAFDARLNTSVTADLPPFYVPPVMRVSA